MIGAFTQPGRTDFQSSLVTLADWLRKSARPNIVTTFDLELPRCRDDLGNAEKLELGVEPIAELRTHLIEMSIPSRASFLRPGYWSADLLRDSADFLLCRSIEQLLPLTKGVVGYPFSRARDRLVNCSLVRPVGHFRSFRHCPFLLSLPQAPS